MLQLELVSSYVKFGVLSLVVGDPARAAEYGREGVQQGEAVVATSPAEKAARRQGLSAAYLVLAEAQLHLGHESEARARIQSHRTTPCGIGASRRRRRARQAKAGPHRTRHRQCRDGNASS